MLLLGEGPLNFFFLLNCSSIFSCQTDEERQRFSYDYFWLLINMTSMKRLKFLLELGQVSCLNFTLLDYKAVLESLFL